MSRRRPRAIDFRKIQGTVSVNGVGMLFAGLAGTLPPMVYSSFSISLVSLTGIAVGVEETLVLGLLSASPLAWEWGVGLPSESLSVGAWAWGCCRR